MADAIDSGSIPARGAGSSPVVSSFLDVLAKYDLLCFDFDGLLVNTEELHYSAYKKMLTQHDCYLSWDFETYCLYSHANRYALRDAVYALFPKLSAYAWETLRSEKQVFYEEMIHQENVTLMPGVEDMLERLKLSSCQYCVVTNSPNDHLLVIKEQIPLLQTIPLWLGRDQYVSPKPHPDPYLAAVKLFPYIPKSRVVAFEDSLKGAQSALAAGIDLIFISRKNNPHLLEPYMAHIPHFASIKDLFLS